VDPPLESEFVVADELEPPPVLVAVPVADDAAPVAPLPLDGAEVVVGDPAPDAQDALVAGDALVDVAPEAGVPVVPEPEALAEEKSPVLGELPAVDGPPVAEELPVVDGVEVAGAVQAPLVEPPVISPLVVVVLGEAGRACRFATALPVTERVAGSLSAAVLSDRFAAVELDETVPASAVRGSVPIAAGGAAAIACSAAAAVGAASGAGG
jgi:hypothetical protein